MRYRVLLDTDSPLVISLDRATGNELGTARHIPGTAWRGAAAALYLEERKPANPEEDEDFAALFLRQRVRFGDLRCEGAKPWPLSARWCAQEREGHGARDLLIGTGRRDKLPLECEYESEGKRCGAKLAQPDWFYRWREESPERQKVESRVTAHTAIANETLRVREGQFYSSEVVERGQRFSGELEVRDEAADVVKRRLADRQLALVVGRGATRGQGRVKVRLTAVEQEKEQRERAELADRIRRLNEAYGRPGEVAFTCTLLSPCVVYDRWLCSRLVLEAGDMAEAAGEQAALNGYELRAWYSRGVRISGWNDQAKLPKADVAAIGAGSGFLFSREIDESERETECQRLAEILGRARTGIGERWEEGFGEVEFCDEFHIRQRTL